MELFNHIYNLHLYTVVLSIGTFNITHSQLLVRKAEINKLLQQESNELLKQDVANKIDNIKYKRGNKIFLYLHMVSCSSPYVCAKTKLGFLRNPNSIPDLVSSHKNRFKKSIIIKDYFAILHLITLQSVFLLPESVYSSLEKLTLYADF